MAGPVDRVESLLAESERSRQALVVVNRTELDPVVRLLDEAFDGQSVTISEARLPSHEANTVVLLRDGELVASSPLQAVMDACLLVNSDLYRTGTSGIDRHEAPAVLTELDETVFELKGFPASDKQKLLLVIMSRYIERLALDAGVGTLRAAFQRFSRLRSEPGTYRVYQRLAETDLELHIYGTLDAPPPTDLAVTVHTGEHDGYRKLWSVTFTPEADTATPGGLVALERGGNRWRGLWTFDPERVAKIRDVIVQEF